MALQGLVIFFLESIYISFQEVQEQCGSYLYREAIAPLNQL